MEERAGTGEAVALVTARRAAGSGAVTPSVVPGTRLEVRIDAIGSDGAGVGRAPGGQVVFVPRTAPGDLAVVEVVRARPRWLRARLLEVRSRAEGRREAPCPYFDRCGGCALQHLGYPEQLAAKGRMVTDALTRIGGQSSLPPLTMHPAPRGTRYRNRITLGLVRLSGGRVLAGFRRLERPTEIIDVDGRCLLPESPVAVAWDALRSAWGTGARKLPAGRMLRLTLRGSAAGEVMLVVEGGRGRGDPNHLRRHVPGLVSIWHRPRSQGGAPRLLAGAATLRDRWHGEDLDIGPDVFLQASREGAAALQGEVLRLAGSVNGKRVLDAYSGYGGVGRRLARAGAQVVAIDEDPGTAQMARRMPEGRFLHLVGTVEERLQDALPSDVVILNPPRIGARNGVMEALGEAEPLRIIYASCDPATLARDIRRLGRGYHVVRLHGFDLFPQTSAVETVAVLQQAV